MAPTRETVAPDTFAHPVFADFAAHRDLLDGLRWPSLDELNERRGDASPGFVAQTPSMLADGLHYETRIAQGNQVATRQGNWHDLLNALVWLRYPTLKRALNARQVADIARVGPRERTRGQCALTLFDEGGIIVISRDPSLLDAWDCHDWPRLFRDNAAIWRQEARVLIFGHALLEHALDPDHLLVGKALVMATSADPHDAAVERAAIDGLAEQIRTGTVLLDPKELRAMPVSGLEGWHRSSHDAGERERFLHGGECFRPLAAGRKYPAPLNFDPSASRPVPRDLIPTLPEARMHG